MQLLHVRWLIPKCGLSNAPGDAYARQLACYQAGNVCRKATGHVLQSQQGTGLLKQDCKNMNEQLQQGTLLVQPQEVTRDGQET